MKDKVRIIASDPNEQYIADQFAVLLNTSDFYAKMTDDFLVTLKHEEVESLEDLLDER